ncbi:MAG: Wzz/FepE/Etk N-terminal domain-containing protein [Melioribacteraceae bacterium]|nr:Wzz/FepE/Etk N-terminal domain-containing protein [Melioribacteraceae bacterium]
MKNQDFMQEQNETTLKDYINLVRQNLLPIIIITLAAVGIAIFYALTATDIYSSKTSLKLKKPQGSILESPFAFGGSDFGNDRFISNEIEVLKSFTTRQRVASSIIDTLRLADDRSKFSIVFKDSKPFSNDEDYIEVKSVEELATALGTIVTIEQIRGLDFVEITAESPSPYEAALIARVYAESYQAIDLEFNRKQLVAVKEFLEEQRKAKLDELLFAEEQLKNFQEEKGVVDINAQATALIEQITNFEAQRNATQIELTISKKKLDQYRTELENQDPRIKDYLESFAAEPYIKNLQNQIAQLQSQRDLALATDGSANVRNSSLIKEYDKKITDLKTKLNEQIQVYKAGYFCFEPGANSTVDSKSIGRGSEISITAFFL